MRGAVGLDETTGPAEHATRSRDPLTTDMALVPRQRSDPD